MPFMKYALYSASFATTKKISAAIYPNYTIKYNFLSKILHYKHIYIPMTHTNK